MSFNFKDYALHLYQVHPVAGLLVMIAYTNQSQYIFSSLNSSTSYFLSIAARDREDTLGSYSRLLDVNTTAYGKSV